MKGTTFAVAFTLTVVVVLAGVLVYPDVLGQAATSNNDLVFAFFIGPFCGLLFLAWLGEKIVLKTRKKKTPIKVPL
jgi:hypothetical protein